MAQGFYLEARIRHGFKRRMDFESDPLQSLRYAVWELDRDPPPWWRARGSQVRDRVHYPVTTSSKEWADELLALDQMVVEGFVATELRKLADASGVKFETSLAEPRTRCGSSSDQR